MIVPLDNCPHGTLRSQKPPKGILKNSRTTDCVPSSPMSDIVVTYSEKQFLGGRETGPKNTQTLGRNHTFSNTGGRPSPNQGQPPSQGARPPQGSRPAPPRQGSRLSSFSVPTGEVCPGSPAHSLLHRPVPDLTGARHVTNHSTQLIANQDVRLSPSLTNQNASIPIGSFSSQSTGASPTIVISRPGAHLEPGSRLPAWEQDPGSRLPAWDQDPGSRLQARDQVQGSRHVIPGSNLQDPNILVEEKSESNEQLFVL